MQNCKSQSSGLSVALAAGAACAAEPARAEAVADAIRPVAFRHGELGGPIDDKVMNLVSNHFLKLDLDRRWISKFRDRTDRGNFRRALAELPAKVCYVTADGALAMNLYAPFRKTFEVDGKTFTLRCETEYPSEGTVRCA